MCKKFDPIYMCIIKEKGYQVEKQKFNVNMSKEEIIHLIWIGMINFWFNIMPQTIQGSNAICKFVEQGRNEHKLW